MKLNTIYTPYTYFIGWSKENLFYYGSRYARTNKCMYDTGCHPDDFWNTYHTSSKYVSEAREMFGEPDIKQVRKTFTTADEAIDWETKVLNKLDVLNDVRWLNENVAGGLSSKVYDDLKEQLYKPIEVKVYGVDKSLVFNSRKEMKSETGLNGVSLQSKLLKDGYLWIRRRRDSSHIFSDGTLLYLPSMSNEINDVYEQGCKPLGNAKGTPSGMKGKVAWNKGIPHTEKTKQKLKIARNKRK